MEYLTGAALKRGKWDVRNYHAMLNILREDQLNWEEVPEAALEALDQYRELLDYHAVFDYSELLSRVVDGLQSGQNEWTKAKSVLQQRIKHVLVDEYQDVNPVQEKLVHLFAQCGAQITVVGDDDQTIYQWRGSAVNNILTFAQRYPNVTTVNVTTNFRSTPAIVNMAEHVAQLNTHRLPKAFGSGSHLQYEEGDIMSRTSPRLKTKPNSSLGAFWISLVIPSRIHPTRARGLAYSDMAILMRSVPKTPPPHARCGHDIPFIVRGVQQLFEQNRRHAIFQYINGDLSRTLLRDLWLDADLGVSEEDVNRAINALPDLFDEDENGC